RKETGRFNGKGYFAGVREVEVLRVDHTVPFDDEIIEDSLSDLSMVETTEFQRDSATGIPQPQVVDGEMLPNVYASYRVGNTQVTDEPLVLRDNDVAYLSVVGGPAEELRLRASTSSGSTLYAREVDYEVAFASDSVGLITTGISRARNNGRLIVTG